ncbi:MAG: hypothetical protein V3U80_06625 [Flavobacteriaceae bacterium]
MKSKLPLLVLIIASLLFIYAFNKPNNTLAAPAKLITVKQADDLTKNFNARYNAMSFTLGKNDNRSSWYSIAELEEYIAYIKSEGASKNLNVDGIRFYFGAYGENDGSYSTMFLVPTVASETDSKDTKKIQPLNYGALGQPPSKTY